MRTRVDDDPGLIVRPFGSICEVLVASPGYLAAHGVPQSPDDLAGHSILSMNDDQRAQRWELQNAAGEHARVEFDPRVAAKDFPMLRRLALDGLGIALLPQMVCAHWLESGALRRVLPEWDLPLGILHAVIATRHGMLPALRALIDHLAETLPAALDTQPAADSAA